MKLTRGSNLEDFELLYRPGYFGRRRDQIVGNLNAKYGSGNWTLAWTGESFPLEFHDACIYYYEHSYIEWFQQNLAELDFVCQYKECIDNAESNIQSGCDYGIQEAFSTHIQDIALRNVLKHFGRKFEGTNGRILVIRSADSDGFKYGPGNIPFYAPQLIEKPSLSPKWANKGSVEDFWQSNKYIAVRK